MKKISIYSRPWVNNMTCSVVRVYETWIFVSFSTKSLKIEDKDEELSSIFEIELQATQTNSNSDEDVS